MSRGTVGFVTANTFEFDSRHRRAADALAADGWDVVVVAMAAPGLAAEERRASGVVVRRPVVDRRILSAVPRAIRAAVGRLLDLREDAERLPAARGTAGERLRAILRRGLEILAFSRRVGPWARAAVGAAPGARIWVAKALVALPVAAEAARLTGGRYVYDIADLHVESGRLAGLPGPLKALLRRREARLVGAAAALIAVTPAMADHVARRFGVPTPTVVMNAREPWRPDEPLPVSPILRETAGLAAERLIVMYQGALRPDQGIDVLLAALEDHVLAELPVTGVFLGFGPLEARLRQASVARAGRVVLLPPVPSEDLLDWTSGADVAFVGTPPTTINQTLTTPNKLFESVMAGVPVLVAGGTWTASLVAEHALGEVVEPWTGEALAGAIQRVLTAPPADRAARRQAVRRAALERLSWDVERQRLVGLFRGLG